MIQYIDKSAVIEEIEKLINEIYAGRLFDSLSSEQQTTLWYVKSIMSSINHLEVKEVDLEKEIKEYLSTYWPKEIELHPFLGHMAKHFFELGLRLQTETNITFKYNIGDSVREYKAQKEE